MCFAHDARPLDFSRRVYYAHFSVPEIAALRLAHKALIPVAKRANLGGDESCRLDRRLWRFAPNVNLPRLFVLPHAAQIRRGKKIELYDAARRRVAAVESNVE